MLACGVTREMLPGFATSASFLRVLMLFWQDGGVLRKLACICHFSLMPARVSNTLSTSVFNH